MIRILICDDQAIAREGLQMILSTAPDMKVVGVTQDGQEALDLLPTAQPDVVLMDLKMPRLNGVQATRAIRSGFPSVRILVLTTYDADEWVFDAVRSGANGYLLKDTPPSELLAAIRNTATGQTPVDPQVAGKIFTGFAQQSPPPLANRLLEELTDREIEVLRLIANGKSNAEIGQQVHLSEGTVRNYISTLFAKLNVNDRTQAVVMALRCGIINLHEL